MMMRVLCTTVEEILPVCTMRVYVETKGDFYKEDVPQFHRIHIGTKIHILYRN